MRRHAIGVAALKKWKIFELGLFQYIFLNFGTTLADLELKFSFFSTTMGGTATNSRYESSPIVHRKIPVHSLIESRYFRSLNTISDFKPLEFHALSDLYLKTFVSRLRLSKISRRSVANILGIAANVDGSNRS